MNEIGWVELAGVACATKCTGEELVEPELGELTVTPANAALLHNTSDMRTRLNI